MKHNTKTKTLQELAISLGATLKGDPQCRISGLATLERAKPGDLSFLTSANYRKFLSTTKASAVIIPQEESSHCTLPALISDNPRLTLAKIATLFQAPILVCSGIHPTAVVDITAKIPESASIGPSSVIGKNVILGENVVIEAGCVVGEACVLGENTTLKPNVTLYPEVKLGKNCLIHSGVVIGSDGFGFAQQEGRWVKMPHLAGVTIGNDVEIGANTTIDRGAFEDTEIGDNVIIDNLVQIGHNVSIGDRTAIAGVAAVAGSARIGKDCMIGGGACVGGHIEIADKVYLTATTGVNHSIRESGVYSAGLPAKPNAQWRKNVARFQYLDDMAKRIRSLEKQLGITPGRRVESTPPKNDNAVQLDQTEFE